MLVFVLVGFGGLLLATYGLEGEALDVVVVRVSGAKGTAYLGEYGTIEKTQTAEGILGARPTNYEVPLEHKFFGSTPDPVYALFRKTKTGGGILKVEIVAGGEVADQNETSKEFGLVSVNWNPLNSDK